MNLIHPLSYQTGEDFFYFDALMKVLPQQKQSYI